MKSVYFLQISLLEKIYPLEKFLSAVLLFCFNGIFLNGKRLRIFFVGQDLLIIWCINTIYD